MGCKDEGATHHMACDCREAAHAEEIKRLTAERDEVRAVRDRLRAHYEAAGPEHDLLALLDLYHERECQARDERDRYREALEAISLTWPSDAGEVNCDGPCCAPGRFARAALRPGDGGR